MVPSSPPWQPHCLFVASVARWFLSLLSFLLALTRPKRFGWHRREIDEGEGLLMPASRQTVEGGSDSTSARCKLRCDGMSISKSD